MSVTFLLGIHTLSAVLAAVVLFEYWRVCRDRAALLAILGHDGGFHIRSIILVVSYILSLVVIALVSVWIVSLLPVA